MADLLLQPSACDLRIPFTHCVMELHRDLQLVVTRFHDGTEAHAVPHDTPEYHAHAIEKTGFDDTMLYCWQHDLMHVMHGEMRQRPSVVLWAVAHDLPVDTDECQQEEREAQDMQRLWMMRQSEGHSIAIRSTPDALTAIRSAGTRQNVT